MSHEPPPVETEEIDEPASRPPLQFGLSTLLGVMVAVSLIFGLPPGSICRRGSVI